VTDTFVGFLYAPRCPIFRFNSSSVGPGPRIAGKALEAGQALYWLYELMILMPSGLG
jgi:hypothetical protein